MEFQSVLEFFVLLNPIRHKYRILGRHIKKVSDMTSDDQKKSEVESMKSFILANPNLKDRKLDNDLYPSKQNELYMKNIFTHVSPRLADETWKALLNLEIILFPDGRPEQTQAVAATGIIDDKAAEIIANNPIISDVIDQLKSTNASLGPNPSMADVMQQPDFHVIIKKILGGMTSGKYKMSDVTKSLADVTKSLETTDLPNQDVFNKESLGTLLGIMKKLENGEAPDMSKMMDIVGKLNMFM